jgi:arylsulfatase A-like enzyme
MRPNLIFILADDLGSADLGCYGGQTSFPVSPNLDRLAANGVRYSNSYSNSPVCSPTRFALMTGRYQYRLRGAAEEPLSSIAKGGSVLGLPPEHPTLPSLLRGAGYRTALVGKWHLGFAPHFGPLKSGFDYFFGATAGAVDYFTHKDSRGNHDLWENEEEVFEDGYFTDLMTDRALAWLDKNAPKKADEAPFLLHLNYTAPHWPWETRDMRAEALRLEAAGVGAIAHLDGGNLETYWRMIHHMDEGIGRIVAQLEASQQLDNTLIVFTSDNGGERFSNNWPFVGGKMDLLEGGIRVPAIAHWPAGIAASRRGQTETLPNQTMDWSATFLAAGGAQSDPNHAFDGVSLLPSFQGDAADHARPLFWRMKHRTQKALRDGRWKYLSVDGNEFLFDIESDGRERANLAKLEPQRLVAMRQSWEDWAATMPGIPADALVSMVYNEKTMPRPT